ncbi:MFS transporter [Mangrovimicrobium sediminis]|uniref:MFS transporter n=1 Tax=Mangrovimicrobium sediminis TaxID=2562682 RepID=A0A4Z0M223_9GAMM|nr:MFS transporter [Haliea sp. SAOS-164]TGD73325.1 MFS transporter [Haliea sp. SAOS-164]
MSQHGKHAAGNGPASPAIGWYSTILLAVLYWLSLLDRSIISLLVDPIKADIGISDVQFGMLHGFAFAITFSLFGLAAGTLADRFSRRTIIFVSVAIWSLATAACGMARDFWHLLLARVGVGAGEAGLNPCATSIITDLFPPARLTLALAVYSLGASAGAGCAFLFGGLLIETVSELDSVTLPLVGDVRPWQAVFYIIGIPGVFIALLAFTMPEPRRRGVRAQPAGDSVLGNVFSGYPDLLRFIRSRGRFFACHYFGFGLASIGFTGGQAWYAAHMGRSFGWNAGEIGLGIGIAMLIGGFAGKFICGLSVSALYRRGYKDAQFLWFSGCLLVATPIAMIAATSASPWVFLAGICLFMLLLSPFTALYVAALNLVTPNELRGTGVAFFGATVGLISLALGPVTIAVFSDYLYGGNAIGAGIATLVALCCPLAALILFLGRRSMVEAVTAAEAWSES